MTDREAILAYLEIHQCTSSWDWDSDLAFAERVGMDVEIIKTVERLIKSPSPLPVKLSIYREHVKPKVTSRRLRALQQLVREGLVESYWEGTGEYGITDLGVNRVRAYLLKKED